MCKECRNRPPCMLKNLPLFRLGKRPHASFLSTCNARRRFVHVDDKSREAGAEKTAATSQPVKSQVNIPGAPLFSEPNSCAFSSAFTALSVLSASATLSI